MLLWRENVLPSTLLGEVERVQSAVVSPDSGIITNLLVTRFQAVKAGDVIAEILSTDTRRLDSQLAMARSKLSLTQLEIGAILDRERLAYELQNIRNEFMRQGIQLAMAKSELEPADRDFKLAQTLLKEKIISEMDFDYFAKIRDPLKAKVDATQLMVDSLEKHLKTTEPFDKSVEALASNSTLQASMAAIANDKKALDAIGNEVIRVKAPISGMVTLIHHFAGENVMAGQPLVTISSQESERIIGYLRQPFPFPPKEGMKVHVRTRSLKRENSWSQISQVGAQYETITNVALLRPGFTHEQGLPIAIGIPASLKSMMRPGELVDLTLHAK